MAKIKDEKPIKADWANHKKHLKNAGFKDKDIDNILGKSHTNSKKRSEIVEEILKILKNSKKI